MKMEPRLQASAADRQNGLHRTFSTPFYTVLDQRLKW
jgi:hypothetical protein